jgi:hypothetical protein
LTWFSFVLSCFWFAQLLESVRLSHLPNLPTQYVFLSLSCPSGNPLTLI